MRNLYLVFYDVRDQGRSVKVAKAVGDYGIRVQKSFFEAILSDEEAARLRRRLASVIDADEDGVRMVRLCAGCERSRIVIGADVGSVRHDPWTCL